MEPDALFWPWPVAGGALIGLSAALYLVLNGRIAGISGMLSAATGLSSGPQALSAVFLAGLLLGAIGAGHFLRAPSLLMTHSWGLLVAGGLLVGFGTRLGSGCTSGHGVCGLARLSPRSVAATLTFMGSAASTVFIVRHVLP